MDETSLPIGGNSSFQRKRPVQAAKKQFDYKVAIEEPEISQWARTYFPCQLNQAMKDKRDRLIANNAQLLVPQQITEQEFNMHVENCTVCKVHVEDPGRFITKRERNVRLYKKNLINFTALIDALLPPTIDLDGCEIRVPETAFLNDEGRPYFIAKTDKDGKLFSVTQTSKLGLPAIRLNFSQVVRERQKDMKTAAAEYEELQAKLKEQGNGKKATDGNPDAKNRVNTSSTGGQVKKTSDTADGTTQAVTTDKTTVTDTVVLRFRNPDDGTQVLSDSRFLALADSRGGRTGIWPRVECIQACVKADNGMGTLLAYEFFAPVDLEALQQEPLDAQDKLEIKYDLTKYPSDLELLSQGRDYDFCAKQCLKMAYYLQIVRKVQLLTM